MEIGNIVPGPLFPSLLLPTSIMEKIPHVEVEDVSTTLY